MGFLSSSVPKYGKLKLIVLGDTGVGKTTLVSRFTNRDLPHACPTIGCNFSLLRLPATESNPEITIDVWDTAGQERYNSILDLYFQDVDVCLLVYDVHDQTSLIRIFEVWLPRFLDSKYNNTADYQHKLFYLVGNKDDKEDVNPQTDQALRQALRQYREEIKKYQIKLWTVSALRNQYLDQLLDDIHQSLLRSVVPFKRSPSEPSDSTVITLLNESDLPRFSWKQWARSLCTIL
jgi:small GTP-binding protein